MNEVNEVCLQRFGMIDKRLSDMDDTQENQKSDITELSVMSARTNERLGALTESMRRLTGALWGVAGAAVTLLVNFVVWYIQTY